MSTIFLPFISPRADLDRRGDRRARGDADRDALDARARAARTSNASSLVDRDHLVVDLGVEDRRDEAGADPLDLVRPGLPPESTGLSAGSTATMRTPGLRAFSTWPTPVIVPPVPTPETKTSISPSVSFQISSAVVRRWISGLAGFSNCCGMTASGISPEQLVGPGDRAAHALARPRSAPVRRRAASASCAARSTSSPASPGSAGSRAPRRRRRARCRCCPRSARSAC